MIEFKFDDKTMKKLISDMSDFPRLILEVCQKSAKAVAAPMGIPTFEFNPSPGRSLKQFNICIDGMAAANAIASLPEMQAIIESAKKKSILKQKKESYYAILNQEKIIEDFGFDPTMIMTSFNWAVEVGKIFDHDLLEIPPEKPKIKNKWIPKRARKKNERKRRSS